MYNGLQNDMTSFAKFAFIFEQEIKAKVKNEEFKSRFKTAFELYVHKVKCRLSGNLVGISINLCKSIQKELFINDTP